MIEQTLFFPKESRDPEMSYGTWPANAPPWPFYFPPFSPQDLNPGAASGSNVGSSRSSGGGVSRTSILTPAIVAIVALLGSAFLIVSYYRVFAKYCTAWQIFWGLRQPDRGRSSSSDQHQSGNGDLEQGWMMHNSGLDEAIVRKIPVYVFKTGQGVVGSNECAVCLGEFEDDDELRLLPKCSHAFHVACIDMWLRSHSNCPLCRAFIVVPQPQQMTRIQHEDDQQPEPEQIQGAAAAEEEEQVEQPIASLQIEPASSMHSDHERDASEFPDSQQQPVDLLRRSLSLELGRHHHHHRRGRRKTRLPQMLRRSHSTGSIPFNYHVSSSLASNNPYSAEFDKNFIHSSSDEYVVLNVEPGCSSNSSSHWVSIDKDEKLDNLNPSPLHSVRKSRSFRASALMRRSLSASGRVFSFRSFGRSKSNTNALGDRQSQV